MHRNIMAPCITLGLALMWIVAGCDSPDVTEEHSSDGVQAATDDDTALDDLAWRYLYEHLDKPADAEPIFAEIRGLDAGQQRRFHERLMELQLEGVEATDEFRRDLEINRAVQEARLERGLGMFDATPEEIDAVVADAIAALPSELKEARASCATAAFPNTVAEQNWCAANAIAAYAYDRRDNDPVAYPACDYRYRFSTTTRRYNVAGHNAATLCALSHNNGALLSSYSSGTQHVLVGYNWLTWCNIWNGGNVTSGLRIF